ncbi:MAG TPA: sugar ABC transporter substrate-binding protein [Symbiobacteriaceae bacterium]|nr:sugar ABC transporter substrate-binding protein [Symbiobacteriaceae bacterium]
MRGFKVWIALVMAAALATAVVGCSKPAQQPENSGTPAGKQVELRFLFPEYSDKTRGLMEQVVKDFNEANKGKIHVTLETSPWDKLHDKLAVTMSGNQAPDVFGYATRWVSEFAELGQLEPLDPYLTPQFKGQFIDRLFAAAAYSPKATGKEATYGLPAAVSARMLFYRKDLFEKAGVKAPANWEELLDAAKKTTNAPNVYGLGVPASGIEVDTFFLYFLWNNGGEILTPDGKAALNSAEGVEALEFLVKLVNEKGSQPKPTGFTREQVIEMFKAGQLAMYPTGPWLNTMIQRDNPSLSYAIAPFPSNKGKALATVGVTDSLGMWAKGANKKEAWQFIEFLYQDKYRQQFDEVEAMLPEKRAVANSAAFTKAELKPFVDALSSAKFVPHHPKFENIQQLMTVAVQKALTGEATPKAALDEAAQKIDALK